jgi:anti-sigma regulatory factor (Ser/Thr protein kinase)
MTPLVAVQLRHEPDVVLARQRAKTLAHLLGCDGTQQVRWATAVSEIARNAFRYAKQGKVQFFLEPESPPRLIVEVTDAGPGIPHLQSVLDGHYTSRTGMGVGLAGARRLCDAFEIRSTPQGTRVRLELGLPRGSLPSSVQLADALIAMQPQSPYEDLQQQNHELLQLLEKVGRQEQDLRHLNTELEATNRGVVAL